MASILVNQMRGVLRDARPVTSTCLVVCLLLSGCATPVLNRCPSLPANHVPPVVAVTSFENRSSFSGQWQLGSGMSDMLVSELVKSGHFTVVEREYLRSVVAEIDRQKDKRFRNEGRVDDGRLKNARYLVRGVINDFSQVSGFSFWAALRSFLIRWKGYKARVSLTLTIVNVETGEIVDSVQCAGLAHARQAYARGRYKNVTFGGDTFFKTPLGKATTRTIRRGVYGIIKKMPRVSWEPMIATVDSDGRIVLNGGSDRGFSTGTVYGVRERGRPVTDPVTGDLLSIVPGPVVGTVRVSTVNARIGYAVPVTGRGFKRGQKLVLQPHGRPSARPSRPTDAGAR